ncbi:sugar ABC transporter substrate-binding protein [Halalkalibacillus sediminis]|uniref:Sugar ABC transporter substrate-binding protein n=1 Tax=Halalkalibacillus sediminis TaxID=2018042 RepID=A0A2I0QVP2_9BACI|nr:sugar ABC transporter substrate-binding protein [Halalkalibacillus sediminis]PKR78170.1 sugar ABC transporter substrate-binding protein [Halalkalibacillus sediminis]
MKVGWLLILSLLAAVALYGCSSDEEGGGEEGTEITYYSFSASPNYEEELDQMVSDFEEQNSDITVNVELAAYDDYFTKLQTQIAGDNAPDVFELNYENFVQYASRGSLADLSSFIEEDEDFDPSQLNEEAYKAFQYDGKQYGMVESFSNVLTFYNKELFDEAGVDYPSADWTWEDEIAAAEQITDADNNVWGTFAPVTMNEFFKIAAQNGGQIFNENGEPTINSPENLEALEYMVGNVTERGIAPSPSDMSGQSPEDLFLNGQLGIVHTGIWMFDAFADASFEWDVQLEAGNTQKAHHFFANGIAVSENTEKKEAAYKFASFMSASQEVAEARVDASWELPAITDEEILAPYLEQSPPENRQAVFDALDSLVLPPVVDNWGRISDTTNQEFEKALNGDKTPQEVLETLESEIDSIMSE